MSKMRKSRNVQRARRLAALALAFALALGLCGCGNGASDREYRPITDVNDMEGRRVAVNLAWEADYLLSGRNDMTLVRYDTFADMILALNYNKVDAFAVDGLVWKVFEANSSGLARVEPPCGSVGYELYFSADREALRDAFNAFLADYRRSEAYADHMARLERFDGRAYVGPELPLTGTGATLKVAVLPDGFPRAFIAAGEDVPTGFDLEALKRFANEADYRLDFYFTSYDDLVHGLRAGSYDLAVGYLSDAYQKDVLAAGLLVSDLLDEIPIYFVEKTREEISVALSELE